MEFRVSDLLPWVLLLKLFSVHYSSTVRDVARNERLRVWSLQQNSKCINHVIKDPGVLIEGLVCICVVSNPHDQSRLANGKKRHTWALDDIITESTCGALARQRVTFCQTPSLGLFFPSGCWNFSWFSKLVTFNFKMTAKPWEAARTLAYQDMQQNWNSASSLFKAGLFLLQFVRSPPMKNGYCADLCLALQ